jgi:hypothetical protein
LADDNNLCQILESIGKYESVRMAVALLAPPRFSIWQFCNHRGILGDSKWRFQAKSGQRFYPQTWVVSIETTTRALMAASSTKTAVELPAIRNSKSGQQVRHDTWAAFRLKGSHWLSRRIHVDDRL